MLINSLLLIIFILRSVDYCLYVCTYEYIHMCISCYIHVCACLCGPVHANINSTHRWACLIYVRINISRYVLVQFQHMPVEDFALNMDIKLGID